MSGTFIGLPLRHPDPPLSDRRLNVLRAFRASHARSRLASWPAEVWAADLMREDGTTFPAFVVQVGDLAFVNPDGRAARLVVCRVLTGHDGGWAGAVSVEEVDAASGTVGALMDAAGEWVRRNGTWTRQG